MKLNSAQTDRACGAVLGSAVGDALRRLRIRSARVGTDGPQMIGGGLGNFRPGRMDRRHLRWRGAS